MQKRMVVGALLSVALIGLTGCPATQVSPGTWLFTLNFDSNSEVDIMTLILEDGGTTRTPDPQPPNGGFFSGTVTWM